MRTHCTQKDNYTKVCILSKLDKEVAEMEMNCLHAAWDVYMVLTFMISIGFSMKRGIVMRRNTSLRNSRKDIPGNFVATVS